MQVGGWAYYDKDDVLYVERERAGRLEWTILGDDGEPIEPWRTRAPPRDLSEFN